MVSKALTKVQGFIIIAVIIVAVVGGAAIYVLVSGPDQSSDSIKIGICADLDNFGGSAILRGAVLATEQVNAEGGVLGRDFEIVSQDDDSESPSVDMTIATNALTKLITVDKADFIINTGSFGTFTYQDIVSEHQKILFTLVDPTDDLTQRVLDDYDKYKYFFRTGMPNATSAIEGTVESIVICREHTGFNKIAFMSHDLGMGGSIFSSAIDSLKDNGFDVVYDGQIPLETVDFSSFFAQAEAAGAEIIYPLIFGEAGIPFIREYYDRQSPTVMWGFINVGSRADSWELTGGKCEHVSVNGYPVVAGYPLTTKTIPTREAYIERWNEEIGMGSAAAYDTVRFILTDAIKRAGTIETEAVIKALEEIDVETSLARRFVFTSSHDVMVGGAGPNRPTEDYFLVALFQWQKGLQVPVYPVEIMEEAGATFTYPPWSGPWD